MKNDDFKALRSGRKIKVTIKKAELIRLLSDQMLKEKELELIYFLEG